MFHTCSSIAGRTFKWRPNMHSSSIEWWAMWPINRAKWNDEFSSASYFWPLMFVHQINEYLHIAQAFWMILFDFKVLVWLTTVLAAPRIGLHMSGFDVVAKLLLHLYQSQPIFFLGVFFNICYNNISQRMDILKSYLHKTRAQLSPRTIKGNGSLQSEWVYQSLYQMLRIYYNMHFQLQRISSHASETWQTTLYVRFASSHGSQRNIFVDHIHLPVQCSHHNDIVSLSPHRLFHRTHTTFSISRFCYLLPIVF